MSEIENVGNLPNGWTDYHQIWHTCADSSGNGHRLKTISSSRPKGGTWEVFGGQKCKNRKIYQAAVSIGTKFVTRLRIHLGMDIC